MKTYNDSPCGINQKTRTALAELIDPTICVFPTIITLNEAGRRLDEVGHKYRAVCSLDEGSVIGRAMKALNDIVDGDDSHLLITHTTFISLTKMVYLQGGTVRAPVLIDEAPEYIIEFTVPHVERIDIEAFKHNFTTTSCDDKLAIVKKRSNDVELWASRQHESELVKNSFLEDLADWVVDDCSTVYMKMEDVKEIGRLLPEQNKKQVGFVRILDTHIFNDVYGDNMYILGSHFQQTEFAILMRLNGEDTSKFENRAPAFSCYPNSDRLTIKYYTPAGQGERPRNWSRMLSMCSSNTIGTSNAESVYDNVASSENTLWIAPVKDRKKVLKRIGGDVYEVEADYNSQESVLIKRKGNLLVKQTHGVNDLRHYTRAVFLGSRNLPKPITDLLTWLGCEPNEVDYARNVLAVYQFVMRSNLRELSSTDEVEVIVPDKRAGDFIHSMFPDATVEYIDWGVKLDERVKEKAGRPIGTGKYPDYFNKADKKAYQRAVKNGTAMLDETIEQWWVRCRHKSVLLKKVS